MAINKVVYGGEVLIDLTSDTVTSETLLAGATAHGKDGKIINGACDFDVNSQDATAAVAEILIGKTAYVRGSKLTGTMKNNGAVKGTISTKDGKYIVSQGYHDGSGYAEIDTAEQAKLIPSNIREGIPILGVVGMMSANEGMKPQAKEATPTKTGFTVAPDEGYNCLSEVVVKPIPYVESDNSAGGTTVTIG